MRTKNLNIKITMSIPYTQPEFIMAVQTLKLMSFIKRMVVM